MKEEGQDINLAGGEPDFKTPSPIIERAYADMKAGFTSYVQSQGCRNCAENWLRNYRWKMD